MVEHSPKFDPTANVKDLSQASNKRQDDLRDAQDRLVDSRLNNLAYILDLHMRHVRELEDAESRRVNEQLTVRQQFTERLELAEAKRIDAIRAVDVNAVAVASQRASDQATVLAAQVAQSAEALRGLVASTANTVAISQQQLATTLSTRITTLEQAQYEGKGKQSYIDPQMEILMAEVRNLRGTRAEGSGQTWGAVGAAVGLLLTLVSIGVAFATFSGRPQQLQLGAPPVVYAPAPTNGR